MSLITVRQQNAISIEASKHTSRKAQSQKEFKEFDEVESEMLQFDAISSTKLEVLSKAEVSLCFNKCPDSI
jgi:hypothetical protein